MEHYVSFIQKEILSPSRSLMEFRHGFFLKKYRRRTNFLSEIFVFIKIIHKNHNHIALSHAFKKLFEMLIDYYLTQNLIETWEWCRMGNRPKTIEKYDKMKYSYKHIYARKWRIFLNGEIHHPIGIKYNPKKVIPLYNFKSDGIIKLYKVGDTGWITVIILI